MDPRNLGRRCRPIRACPMTGDERQRPMEDARLTVAQALVALPRAPARRARRRASSRFFAGLLRHLRPRQRRRARPGAAEQRRDDRAALPPGAQRAGDGPRGRRRTPRCANRLRDASPARPRSARARRTWSPGAAPATVNRLPVLLLPGDIFATRRRDPVLQQLEIRLGRRTSRSTTASSRSRATGTASTGPSSCCRAARGDARADRPGRDRRGDARLPQDVQAEAFDFPAELFEQRVWHVAPAAAGRRRALGARASR